MSSKRNRKAQNSRKNSQRKGRAEHLAQYQFKPGQSGNPGGRPKKLPGTIALRADLQDPELAQKLGRVQIRKALRGDTRAFKEILDRVEGKVPIRIEHSGPDGEEIKAKVDAKLSVGDLLGALRTIYGLSASPETPNGPAASVPVPADVGERPSPPQDREKK